MMWTVYPVDAIDALAGSWDSLNHRGPNSPLLTTRFLRPALRAFAAGKERLACMGSAEDPTAMAIVLERKLGVWETFQPSQAPIGFWLMQPGLDLEATALSLGRSLSPLTTVLGITQQDPGLVPKPSVTNKLSTVNYIDTARIMVSGQFDSYWEGRGKNLRQNMRKARNKLEKAGKSLNMVCLTDPREVRAAIENYGRLESSGWKAQNGTAVNLDNAQGRFYCELLESHCDAGLGRIYQLMFDDQIVAMDLCVELDGTIVILKTTYDESASEYSPAMLMHQELFQSLFASGDTKKIEFYGKVMDWHLRWTEDIRTMYHINCYRWGWLKKLRSHSPAQPE